MKKLVALFLAGIMLFALTSCTSEEAPERNRRERSERPAAEDEGLLILPPDEIMVEPDYTLPQPEEPNPFPVDMGDFSHLPRNETLYFTGWWGPVSGWNAFSVDMNNWFFMSWEPYGAASAMFETPYMFNPLCGSFVPLLADGGYRWNDDRTELRFDIKPAARWSDGTPVTAHDVAFTWEAGNNFGSSVIVSYDLFIDRIAAESDSTVVIYSALNWDGQPVNPLMVRQYLIQNYVLQRAWLENLIERNNYDRLAINAEAALDIVFSGAYGPYGYNDNITVAVRNDDYWGQDVSMWGRLPAPRYLAAVPFQGTETEAAFLDGHIDVCSNYIANAHLLWLDQGLPISTYYPDAPYHISMNMPTAFYNMNNPILHDYPEIRRAIAWAVDYDFILANSMTNQGVSFRDFPRSLMNPNPCEQAMYNQNEVAHLQWTGGEIERANAYLDAAGILIGDSGWREINGVPLSFVISCPAGWSDWEMAMMIVAEAGEALGIEMITHFPDWGVYANDVIAARQDNYDIFMMWTDSSSPAQPWSRIRNLMSSELTGMEGNWSGNWGQYWNPRADELLRLIPQETDEAMIRAYYTELIEIYLTDVPSFSLMYRPGMFHYINESVWTGFADAHDGRNVPPMNAVFGYGLADLFNIRLVH